MCKAGGSGGLVPVLREIPASGWDWLCGVGSKAVGNLRPGKSSFGMGPSVWILGGTQRCSWEIG